MTTHARPLATFILFAYNQERFVREAIAAALAQDYEPLEIILSDDCSSDRTFDFMQEMAAGYRGPHSVRAARTSRNLGVTQHVLGRGREARGEIVVVAAGDDISKPHRTSRIV
ncbi:MAG TPA: glycosyltransferase family A protein, partial [Caulobacteraceae bacterium]|nr:glycosyltransferase family A protein [Caulobacteraceae bacterium]